MSAVQTWRLLGAADLEAIARALQPLAQSWASEWLPDAVLKLSVVDAHTHPLLRAGDGEQMLSLNNKQGGAAAIAMYRGALASMLQRQAMAALGATPEPCPAGASDGIPAALAHYQLRDLLARLARLPAGSVRNDTLYSLSRAPVPRAIRINGAVLVLLTLDNHAMRVWLPHEAVAGWCRRPIRNSGAPLLARTKALAGCSLPFRLQVGVGTLALADLLALQPGNVIRLDSGLDQPMELVTGDGPGFGHCYLGLRDGSPVIQLCS